MKETSKLAKEQSLATSPDLRDEILQLVANAGKQGLTRHEVAFFTGRLLQTVCGRITPMVSDGVLLVSDQRRATPTGSLAEVLVVAPGYTSLRAPGYKLELPVWTKGVTPPKREVLLSLAPIEKKFGGWVDRDKNKDCWVWTGPRSTAGVPRFAVAGAMLNAQAFAYEMLYGELPETFDKIATTCGESGCVNPHHITFASSPLLKKRVAIADKRQGNLF